MPVLEFAHLFDQVALAADQLAFGLDVGFGGRFQALLDLLEAGEEGVELLKTASARLAGAAVCLFWSS